MMIRRVIYPILLLALTVNASAQSENALVSEYSRTFTGAYPEAAPTGGEVVSVELTAKPGQWSLVPPYQTEVWTYNQQIPGPEIRIKLGQTLKVRLNNELPQSTTIHWHGVRVPNAMDGVPGVNQEAVPPGGSFTYEFTPKDPGTFWFHPHVNSSEQVERGLHGVLIVEAAEPLAYDQDLVLVADDWLLEKGAQIYPKFNTRHDLSHDGRWGNFITVNGRFQPVFEVHPGQRIRLRLINVANGRVFKPMLNGLSAKLIAVDGMAAAKALPLKDFYLSPGNRIDLDIVIPADKAGEKIVLDDVFSRRGKNTLAILQVSEQAPVPTPDFPSPVAGHFPQWPDVLKVPVAHEFLLDGRRGGPFGITWTIDGQAWPKVEAPSFKAGDFVRLRFTNTSPRLHPMHIHGQFFRVVARDGKPVDEPFWRDTVLIGSKEMVDIAMVPLDQGTWVNHCHILEHAQAGMMTKINVD